MLSWLSALARTGTEVAQREVKKLALMVGLLILAGLLLLVALGFITAGVYTAIRNELEPVSALFIMAGIFLVLALIAFLVANRGQRKPRRRVTLTEEVDEALPPGREGDRLASLGTVAAAFAFGLVRGLTRRRRG
ncbi:MAG: phage holin family protein [Bauldia sp.]|nr:phage holin family protein [Bauldia sp.]MCW5718266.1 phage holin family protein [Bauldia sp.]